MSDGCESYEVLLNNKSTILNISETSLQLLSKSFKVSHQWLEVLCAIQSSDTTLELKIFSIFKKHPKHFSYTLQTTIPSQIIQSLEHHLSDSRLSSHQKKRFKVIINPVSGNRSAYEKWNTVKGMFDGCELEVENTQFKGHATEIVKSMSSLYDGIIVVSGDGLVHEVINGLCDESCRPIKNIPVGVIPAGSWNALAQYACKLINKSLSVETCAYICLKGTPNGIDISKISFEPSKTVFSFLSVSWAFISDVDAGSNKLRGLGMMRYYLYGAWRYLALRRYAGTLTWKIDDNYFSYSGAFTYFLSANLPYLGEDKNFAPFAQHDDGMNDIMFMGNSSKMQLLKVLLKQDSGQHLNLEGMRYFKTNSWSLQPNEGVFSIDGEVYEIGSISVEVLPNFCTILLFHP
jgi:sphingosine kinase